MALSEYERDRGQDLLDRLQTDYDLKRHGLKGAMRDLLVDAGLPRSAAKVSTSKNLPGRHARFTKRWASHTLIGHDPPKKSTGALQLTAIGLREGPQISPRVPSPHSPLHSTAIPAILSS